MSGTQHELPLFPLNTVLFPGMTLPLRIFEPRYLQMVHACLRDGTPFGVLLIRDGHEVGGAALPYDVGTTARLAALEELQDGVLRITTVGQNRFRLLEMSGRKPYLVGTVEMFPLENTDAPQVGALVDIQMALLSVYLELLTRLNGVEIQLQSQPETPEAMAYLVAMLLQVSLAEKQDLLSIPDLPSLLHQEAALLRGEVSAITVLLNANETLADDGERSALARN